MSLSRRACLALAVAAAAGAGLGHDAQAQAPLKVIVFPGLSNLPIFAAQSQGLFAKHGVDVEIFNTPNSGELRDGLAQGKYHIAHGGVDNAVAMAEVAKVDVAVIMGGDGGLNHLFVQPEIKSYDDLRGKKVIVDAPNTAFALLLYKMLQEKGLKKGDYEVVPVGATFQRLEAMLKDKSNAAAMLNPPFSVRAKKEGLKDMGSAIDVVGPYQSGSGWVVRSWGEANADTLVRYTKAYIEGVRWAMNPANKAAAIALLAERLRLPQDVTAEAYEMASDTRKGIAKDAKFDMEGFRNVLKLRAEILGQWGGNPPAPDKYLDLSYYDRAVAGL
jgi:ABC-type nitrate/sulfonate/bicarbonate transport system substrate-binding protein